MIISYRFCVAGFYEAHKLPEPVDSTQVSQIVVDTFSSAHGVTFIKGDNYNFKGERDVPSTLAQCIKMRYKCQQQARKFTASKHDYTKTRNRVRKLQRFDCKGQISIYFPNAQSDASFDFALDYRHAIHEGSKHFGVPKCIRDWIHNNPQPSPLFQREALIQAIKRGELPTVKYRYFPVSHISYWWRKKVAERTYISKDAWVNVDNILRNHPSVFTGNGAF